MDRCFPTAECPLPRVAPPARPVFHGRTLSARSRTTSRQRTLVFGRRSVPMRVLAVIGLTGLLSGYGAPIAFAASEPGPTKTLPALDIPAFAYVQFDDNAAPAEPAAPKDEKAPAEEPAAEDSKPAEQAPAPSSQQQEQQPPASQAPAPEQAQAPAPQEKVKVVKNDWGTAPAT